MWRMNYSSFDGGCCEGEMEKGKICLVVSREEGFSNGLASFLRYNIYYN